MSKINQIQNKLKEMSGESFQKLADAYLHKKGYGAINSLGSVIGADKVKTGTPDTMIPRSGGTYIFAEYTTLQTNLHKKLMEDVNKCFDEKKTGISIGKIEEIVICHNSSLSLEDEDALREECQKRGVNLNIFGLLPISFDLYQKYPGIARDFLGVEVDTGQIVDLDQFVMNYNKSPLATPLDTSFYFREKEKAQVLEVLKNGNIVFVTGRSGVGKSRLALECIKEYMKIHPEYEAWCIFNRGADIFEDLRVQFAEQKNYILFVDDANRVSGLEYILQLLIDNREGNLKIISTVRDYAIEKVRSKASRYGLVNEVLLETMDDEKIREFVKGEYGINNGLYLNRILEIAQGNARLAVMAARIAVREQTLQSIRNVSVLYEEYYRSIKTDLEDLEKPFLLKVAGIVSFLRTVDRTNETLMRRIEEAFGVSPEEFWEAARQLHALEVFDMYENEIVRISDQVLATYLFYLAFFSKRELSFRVVLEYFFSGFSNKIVDALNPVINAFDSKFIIDTIRSEVEALGYVGEGR